jgi:hypothetical protein
VVTSKRSIEKTAGFQFEEQSVKGKGFMMKLDNAAKKELYELEKSLWRPETRFDKGYMNGLLTEDFFEFGRSGRTYRREEILSALMQEIDIDLPLKDFQIHRVADDVVLVTYVSEVQYDELEVGNRSSLWVRKDGGWKLRFHQGTAVQR